MQPWDMPTYGELTLVWIAVMLTAAVVILALRRK